MDDDIIWQAFAATGDPRFYLMYKSEKRRDEKNDKTDRRENSTPVSED